MDLNITPIYPMVDLTRTSESIRVITLVRVAGPDGKFYLTMINFNKRYYSKVDEDSMIKIAIAQLAIYSALLKYDESLDQFGNQKFVIDPNQESEEIRLRKINGSNIHPSLQPRQGDPT